MNNFEPKFGGGSSEGPPFLDEAKKVKEYADMIVSQENVPDADKMVTAEKMAKTFSLEGGQELVRRVGEGIQKSKSAQSGVAAKSLGVVMGTEGMEKRADAKKSEKIWRGEDSTKW